jgi:hypothetical protein
MIGGCHHGQESNRGNMQPYQKASQERQRHEQLPFRVAEAGLGVASRAVPYAAGGALFQRALPFLSKYIPEDLAIKGLSKIDPRFGKFISKAMQEGESFEQVKSFIQGKVDEGLENIHKKDNRNIIEQYDPDLHQYIDQEIKKGRSPIEAGALAQLQKKFMKSITKLTKDHKTPWSGILESVYGAAQEPNSQPIQQDDQQQSEQQPGQGQQALMAILQKIQQARGMQ